MTRSTYFVTCVPGTEPFLFDEVKRLGLARVESQVAGVRFDGTRRDAWSANLWLRTAIRVLERLDRFPAPDENSLYAGVKALEWERWLAPDGRLAVDARSKDSELFHTRFLSQLVKDAICDRFRESDGVRPSVDVEDPDLRVDLHLFNNRATISLDTSGVPLYRRGWRVHQGRAPIAENLAAALVLASGWNGKAPLVDPFMGSGTILVEGALLAAGRAPGARRTFGFERWRDHDARAYTSVRDEARAAGRPTRKLTLSGRDVDPARVEEARANLAAAETDARVELEVGDARDWHPRPGWNACVVTNPPYGARVGDERQLGALYEGFARKLAHEAGGYRVAMITSFAPGLDALPFRPERRTPILNGGIECELVVGEVPRAGT
ncbi:MAG: THUMP domain-containing protein [Planctomycetota bacterium]